MDNFKKDLEWRGLLKDITNEKSLERIILNKGKFYIGIDPTADSIHLGHFLSLNLAKILNNHGLQPIVVIGGFTGMIGDPSGRNSERDIIDRKTIKNNVIKIEKQIKDIFINKFKIRNIETYDNTKIYDSMSIIDLYQKYGKMFNMNKMLSKDSVKKRLETGISYTEFSYQMFQAIDFLKLFEEKDVRLQLGGSDQWGNITAGIDLIKKIKGSNEDLCGVTINLLVDENENKIGKTQGRPIWMDKQKTSPYEIYQYFINLNDELAEKLLKQITDISKDEFDKIIKRNNENKKEKIVHYELAKKFISMIHSEDEFNECVDLSKLLFEERYNDISKKNIKTLKMLHSIKNKDMLLMDLLIEEGKVKSRREYREFLKNNSIRVNGIIVSDENLKLKNEFILDDILFVNIGKKNKTIIHK